MPADVAASEQIESVTINAFFTLFEVIRLQVGVIVSELG